MNIAIIASVVAVLIGLLDMPYDYYMLLRTILFISCGYAAYLLYEKDNMGFILLGLLALLYNPFFPIHLHEKAIWIALNFGALGALFWARLKTADQISHHMHRGSITEANEATNLIRVKWIQKWSEGLEIPLEESRQLEADITRNLNGLIHAGYINKTELTDDEYIRIYNQFMENLSQEVLLSAKTITSSIDGALMKTAMFFGYVMPPTHEANEDKADNSLSCDYGIDLSQESRIKQAKGSLNQKSSDRKKKYQEKRRSKRRYI